MVFEEKIFKVYNLVISDNRPCFLWAMFFLRDSNGLKEFDKESAEKYFCEIILKLAW